MSKNQKTVLIMAGGTGGHIFPALSIAKTLKSNNTHIEWLGSENGMENTLVPNNNITLHCVSTVGLRGKSMISLLKAPFKLTIAFFQTMKVYKNTQPDVVLGMGGFTSGIGGIVAWLHGIPLVIHEQNSIPGTTNKLLSKFAKQVFQAFEGSFESSVKALTTGNPVLLKPKKKKNTNKKLNILVLGGSLGAKPINEIISKLNVNANIWHQTGKQHFESVKAQYTRKNVKITAFIEDMAEAYAWADVVICRSGAMTVSELICTGSASILIPLPHAVDNHQYFNAKILLKNNAGILIEQTDLTVDLLEKTINQLDKQQLVQMGENAKKLSPVNTNKIISDYLIAVD